MKGLSLIPKFFWLPLMMAIYLCAPVSLARDLVKTGYARDPQTGRLLYVESHYVREEGAVGENRLVLYRCGLNAPAFARKEVTYNALRQAPEFVLTDERSGYSEGVRRVGSGLRAFVQENATTPKRESSLKLRPELVIDAGFDEFVRSRWAELEGGQALAFPFLVPSRLDTFGFKLRKHRDAVIDGQQVSVFRLNLSGVLGWFTSHIDISYRKADRVLMRYEGVSNIRGEDGRNLLVRIDFPANERRSMAAVDLTRARIEPLTSRCAG